jgi:lipopolysaccharide export system protein LptA
MCKQLTLSFIFISLLLSASFSVALKEDRFLDVYLEFDFVEMDINSGELIYTGNVTLQQGNLVIQASKIHVWTQGGGVLSKAEATGYPATIQDVLDDNIDPDLTIKGKLIEYDAANEQIIVTGDAYVEKGENKLSAYQVFYDISAGKVRAKKGGEQQQVKMRFNSPSQAESAQ